MDIPEFLTLTTLGCFQFTHTSVDTNDLSGNPAAIFRKQKCYRLADIFRLTVFSQRMPFRRCFPLFRSAQQIWAMGVSVKDGATTFTRIRCAASSAASAKASPSTPPFAAEILA